MLGVTNDSEPESLSTEPTGVKYPSGIAFRAELAKERLNDWPFGESAQTTSHYSLHVRKGCEGIYHEHVEFKTK